MPLPPEQQVRVRNILERWLALNADAEDATFTVTLTGGDVKIETTERTLVRPPPVEPG